MTLRHTLPLALATIVLSGCGTTPADPTPAGSVAFPRANARPDIQLTALLAGTVILQDGCLFVGRVNGPKRLVIWPYGTRLEFRRGTWVIIGDGVQVSVGEEVALGGGSVDPIGPEAFAFVDTPPPTHCLDADDGDVFGASNMASKADFDRRHPNMVR